MPVIAYLNVISEANANTVDTMGTTTRRSTGSTADDTGSNMDDSMVHTPTGTSPCNMIGANKNGTSNTMGIAKCIMCSMSSANRSTATLRSLTHGQKDTARQPLSINRINHHYANSHRERLTLSPPQFNMGR